MQISFLTFWWAHAKVSSISSSSSTKAKLAQTLFRFMRFDKLWLHLMCAYGVTCPFHVTPLATRAKKLDTLTQPHHSFLLATDTQFPVGISISVDMSSGFVGLAVGVDVAGYWLPLPQPLPVFCTPKENSAFSWMPRTGWEFLYQVVAESFGSQWSHCFVGVGNTGPAL